MEEILKKSHIFILIAIVVGVAAFVSRPSYAGWAFSEIPYATKSSSFDAGKTVVTVRWSDAYSKMSDGTISDVSGYEIQYASNPDFKDTKKLFKGKSDNKAEITLRDLNTETKYGSEISNYHFRVRSYVTIGGKKSCSRWAVAEPVKSVTIYSPVALTSISSDRNVITAEWNKVAGAQGYIVFGKKVGSSKWEKKCLIKDTEEVTYKEKDLAFSCEYMYSVMSYRKQEVTDPSKFNTSYLRLLNDGENVYKIATKDFNIETPKVRALFNKDVLNITWKAADGAQNYHVEISENESFSNPRVFDIDESMLIDGMTSFTQELDDVEHKDYYVRVRASGTFNDSTLFSEYSEVKLAKFGAGVYTLKFDSNGGEGEMESCLVGEDEEFDLPENKFTRPGYRFIGWTLSEDTQSILDADIPLQIGEPQYEDEGVVKGLAASGKKVKLYACWQGSGPEAAADWAELIAADDDFYYGKQVKNHCWFCQGGNKTYICNAFVASAYTHGMPYFSSWRSGSTEYSWWLKNGFSSVGMNAPLYKVKKGDIICCHNGKRWGHIVIAITDGDVKDPLIAHAARKGTDPDSIRLDSMGNRLKKYKRYYVVRYDPAG